MQKIGNAMRIPPRYTNGYTLQHEFGVDINILRVVKLLGFVKREKFRCHV